MKLSRLVEGIEGAVILGQDVEIMQLAFNTNDVKEGSTFFCIEGTKVDGHTFSQKAVDAGAIALVVSKNIETTPKVTIVKVPDTRKAMALMSSNFYGNPSKKMKVIGITGTNGKTTSTFMLKSILDNAGVTTGLIGTIYNISANEIVDAKRTTPESMDLQNLFSNMVGVGVDVCIMEVSSHSLVLDRVYGVDFEAAAFTNLTQDHLDYHLTMENYFNAKMRLFDNCGVGVVNIDDEYGRRAVSLVNNPKLTYGIDNPRLCDVYAEDIVITGEGTDFTLFIKGEKSRIHLNMPGKFNVYNALCCATLAFSIGITIDKIAKGLNDLQNVPGRSEKIKTNKDYTIVIDYAHSPDGIENILRTAREYTVNKLYILFGCGGDRDKTKRSIMGHTAGRLADYCIVTSDNPRSEEPEAIIKDIIPGLVETDCPYKIIPDRTEAIRYALNTAGAGDVIIIAGKGHETYQVLKDRTIHYDEREIIKSVLKEEF